MNKRKNRQRATPPPPAGIPRRRMFLPVFLLLASASARAATLNASLFGLEPFDLGDPLVIELRARNNTERVGAYEFIFTYSGAILAPPQTLANWALNTSDFRVTSETLASPAPGETRMRLRGEALSPEGAPPTFVIFSAVFTVRGGGCAGYARLEPPEGGAPVFANAEGAPIATSLEFTEIERIALLKSGDVNADGRLDTADADALKSALLAAAPNPPQLWRADLTSDCALDAADYIRYRRGLALRPAAAARPDAALILADAPAPTRPASEFPTASGSGLRAAPCACGAGARPR